MTNRDLLADAIADAKAVKEVAIANAKAALEEAFTPHLKDMLSQKINEMDEDLDLAEVDKEKKLDEELENEGHKKELDLEEILAELELEESSGNIDPGAEPKSFLKKKSDSSQLEEDARTDAEEEGYLDGIKDEKEDLSEESEAERADVDKYEYEKGKDAGEDEDAGDVDVEDVEINLDEMSEDELKDMIEDVIEDMVSSGDLEAGGDAVELVDDEEEVEIEDVTVDVTDTEEIELEEDARTDAEEEGYLDGKADEKKKIKKDLKEARKVITHLRSEINEVNLLNSKLLYTNKIFKGKNLTENQKIKVLKAFDKAETVKEAKRIFEALNENLVAKSTKSNIREAMGAASKPAGIAPRRRSTKISFKKMLWLAALKN